MNRQKKNNQLNKHIGFYFAINNSERTTLKGLYCTYINRLFWYSISPC